MPTARKLPSGSWRCQVFSHRDENGKRIYKSFICSDPSPQGKKVCEAEASAWAKDKKSRLSTTTVGEAVSTYIAAKEHVLSPSTIRGYQAMVGRFDSISGKRIDTLRNADVQMWVSGLAAKLSAKSVENTYGLFTAAVDLIAPGTRFRVTLPAKEKPEYHLPTDEELQAVLNHTKGKPLWIALMLARYYSLRRSEICALRSEDLSGNVLTIRRAMIKNKAGEWVTKERPKTYGSYRYLIIDEPLLSELKKCSGEIIGTNPDALDNRLDRAIRATGVEPFGIHSLRHKFATKAALSGIPDIFTAQMGGWRPGSKVLKEVYQNVLDDDFRKQMEKINGLMRDEMTGKKKKSKAKKPMQHDATRKNEKTP